MIDSDGSRRFWNNAALKTSLVDKASAGMLTEGNEFNAIYRRNEEEAHFLRIFRPASTMRVLEVGSGGGRWSFFLADKVSSVTGIDFSSAMVELADQQRIARGLDNVRFINTDLLNFNDGQKYDLVYFSGVLQYMNDEEVMESIRKARSMLSPGGVIISRDTVQQLERVVLEGEYPVVYRTVDEYAGLFLNGGFHMDYCQLSYQPRRFAGVVSRIFGLPFVSFKIAFALQELLISVDNWLGHPRFLKNQLYRRMLDNGNLREHVFFRYQLNVG
jgi:ubiquinone/menaquinone biosynthesis C-methylase UbiE